jgi:hypothetical protein
MGDPSVRLRRLHERGRYDRATIYPILDMDPQALRYLDKSDGWAVGSDPNVVVIDKGAGASLRQHYLVTQGRRHSIWAKRTQGSQPQRLNGWRNR